MFFDRPLLSLTLALAGLLFGLTVAQDDYTCGPDRPCELGCCSNIGVCGMGPTFCGQGNCTSQCGYKSDCDPGWGPEYSAAEKCPLNVCCSEFGFCGTTELFCGDNKVKKPSCSGSSSNQRTIGYYEGWSTTRACDGMYPENIPVGAYTHLNYAFAFVDPVSLAVAPMSETDKDLWPRFTKLKEDNAGLKTFISVGGWSMNDPDQPTAKTFSNLAASQDAQQKFFKSLISFMGTYGFDGVDVDWEYPVAEERGGIKEDFENNVVFLRKLKAALAASGHSYGLTITVPSSYWYLRHFNTIEIDKIIDWFNIMTYDLHGTWDSTIDSLGPKVMAHTNLTEIDMTMDLFWRNNIDPGHISAGCGFSGGGKTGDCTNNVGTLSFVEIQRLVDAGADVTLDKDATVQIVTWDNDQWLDYANKLCLSGSMVWASSTYDSLDTAAQALSATTGKIALSLKATDKSADTFSQCTWGECAPKGKTTCPAQLSAAQFASGKGKGNIGFYNDCGRGEERAYCCHTRLCCSRTSSDSAIGTCKWEGASPACSVNLFGSYGCDESDREELTYSAYGAGGEQPCWTGWKNPTHCSKGSQYFCCDNPVKIPDQPDVKLDFCYSTEGDFVEASEKDDWALDSDDILELWWYEDERFSIPNTADPSVQKINNDSTFGLPQVHNLHRSEIVKIYTTDGELFEVPLREAWVQDLLDQSVAASIEDTLWQDEDLTLRESQGNNTLEERNKRRFTKICGPDNTVVNTFSTSPYPGVSLRTPSLLVFNLGTQGVCFGAALVTTAHSALTAGLKTVVEHATELQTPKAFINSLLAGKLPSGTTGFNLRYNVESVFGSSGYFDWDLSTLNIAQFFPNESPTTTVSTLFFKYLGSSSYIENLQLLTAKENSLKAAIWGLYENINADKK
ncbi:glycoside hydrolase [Biscogniauxia marginata]|nr:glycoside hydrolase [Biscogniauxia marginata]